MCITPRTSPAPQKRACLARRRAAERNAHFVECINDMRNTTAVGDICEKNDSPNVTTARPARHSKPITLGNPGTTHVGIRTLDAVFFSEMEQLFHVRNDI
jgi:hypothetical protein